MPTFPKKKTVIAGVGKVLKLLQWIFKVLFEIDPTGPGQKGCNKPVFTKFQLKTQKVPG